LGIAGLKDRLVSSLLVCRLRRVNQSSFLTKNAQFAPQDPPTELRSARMQVKRVVRRALFLTPFLTSLASTTLVVTATARSGSAIVQHNLTLVN
jgi:hypothetical protein